MRRMLTAKLQNRSGVSILYWCLSRRQVNIESISVGATEDPTYRVLPSLLMLLLMMKWSKSFKQLNRQIDVIRIRDITDKPHLSARLSWLKYLRLLKRAEFLAIIQPFRATVVDVAPSSITIQMTGNAEKVKPLLRVIRPYGIQEYCSYGCNWIYPRLILFESQIKITKNILNLLNQPKRQ